MLYERTSLYLALPYLVSALLYLFGPVAFSYPSGRASLVLMLTVIAFLVCYSLGAKAGRSAGINREKSHRLSRSVVVWYKISAPIALLGAIAYVHWILQTGTSLSLVYEDTGEVRELTRQTGYDKMFYGLFAYQAYGFIPILLTPYRKLFPVWVHAIYVATIMLMALAVVVQSGRTFFLVFVLLVYASYSIFPSFLREKVTKSAYFWVSIVTFIFVAIPVTYFIMLERPGSSAIVHTNLNASLRYDLGGIEDSDNEAFYAFVSTFHYVAGPLSNLSKQIEAEESIVRLTAGPLRPILSRFIDVDRFERTQSEYHTLRRYLALGGELTGWRTGYGSMVSWYGLISIIPFASLLGYLLARKIVVYQRSLEIYQFVSTVWVVFFFCSCLFYFSVDSVFLVNVVTIFLVVRLVSRLRFGRSSRADLRLAGWGQRGEAARS